MVHALEQLHEMLESNGRLLDLHPIPEPPTIHVRLGEETHLAGWLQEADDYVEYQQAEDAIATAVARQLYTIEKQSTFTFKTYAPDIYALRDHLAENWQDAIISEQVIRRADELMGSIEPDQEVILREVVRISLLRR